jgi:hypothetical protein
LAGLEVSTEASRNPATTAPLGRILAGVRTDLHEATDALTMPVLKTTSPAIEPGQPKGVPMRKKRLRGRVWNACSAFLIDKNVAKREADEPRTLGANS